MKQEEELEFPSVHHARVNCALLSKFHGKPVCVLGNVIKADGGSAFQLRCSDGGSITVRLKKPINEPLTGTIEVYGIGQGKSLVICDDFTVFPDDITSRFDLAVYNEYVKLLNANDME